MKNIEASTIADYTYICLLRGINVSGQRKIKMDQLKSCLQNAGFSAVQTYIQSGNIVLKSTSKDAGEVQQLIEKHIAQDFGFDVPATIVTPAQWKTVLSANPFYNNQRNEDKKSLHVTMLEHEPDSEKLHLVNQVNSGEDEYRIHHNLIYLFCPNGYGRTKLTNNFFEQKLRQKATTRNWNTVLAIAELISDDL